MTETVYTMPLTNVPQRFSMDIVGVTYIILCRWNESIGWSLDISNADDVPMVCCLPLTVGVDLLGQYAYLGINAALYVYTDGAQFEPPTLENLGRESNLYLLVQS